MPSKQNFKATLKAKFANKSDKVCKRVWITKVSADEVANTDKCFRKPVKLIKQNAFGSPEL